MLSDSLMTEIIHLMGAENVSATTEAVLRHSYDAWPVAVKWKLLEKQPLKPDVVVYATSTEQISTLLRWATANQIAVTPWGAGSSVTGAPLPLNGGITLDLSRMSRFIRRDELNMMVTVETGMMGDVLEQQLNAAGYTLNHSPQSLNRSTVGGWIATRATGQFSSRYGGIEDLVVSLKAVLPDGTVLETTGVPRASTGMDLRQLFLGSEGTMGVVTEITLRMFAIPPYRKLETVQFSTVEDGVTAMRRIIQLGLKPFLVRFYDEDESRHAMKDSSFDGCAMFLGFEGLESVASAEYEAAMKICSAHHGVLLGGASAEAWMNRRYDFSTVENLLHGRGGVAETIEIAHLWDAILPVYHEMKAALRPYATEVLGHFSHVYTHGTSLYLILLGHADSDSEAEQRILQIWDIAMSTALEHGAALSHHHGVGVARLPFIRKHLGEGIGVMEIVKHALDPAGIMSPGKLGINGR
jgi:alkyldihydroxyacetonephosphate synthase